MNPCQPFCGSQADQQSFLDVAAAWQPIVTPALGLLTIAAAFFGFWLGTWLHYYYQQRTDARRRDEKAKQVARVLLAECTGILARLKIDLSYLVKLDYVHGEKDQTARINSMLTSEDPAIYTHHIGDLGLLPAEAIITLIRFYDCLDDQRRDFSVYGHYLEKESPVEVGEKLIELLTQHYMTSAALGDAAMDKLSKFSGEEINFYPYTTVLETLGKKPQI